jgi:nucleoside recognition membrane protein YjiH
MSGRIKSIKTMLSGLNHTSRQNCGTVLGEAVKNSVSVILTIGGFIVFFSVIIRILAETGVIRHLAGMISPMVSPLGMNDKTIEGILSGLFEVTTGSRLLAAAEIPPCLKLPALSFIIGWAGLSVHLQVTSIISGTGVRMLPYLLAKFLHGVIAAFYTWAGLKILPIPAFAGIPVPGSVLTIYGDSHRDAAGNSFLITFMIIILLIILTALSRGAKINRTKKRSPI